MSFDFLNDNLTQAPKICEECGKVVVFFWALMLLAGFVKTVSGAELNTVFLMEILLVLAILVFERNGR